MTVFFTFSTKEILHYKDFYLEIRDSISDLGHKINRDWTSSSISLAEKGVKDVAPSSVYKKVLNAILTADAVIVDATVRSMSIGHQISFALEKKKPVLLLRYSGTESNTEDMFIISEKTPLLIVKEYSRKEEIRGIIEEFLNRESRPKVRFNLVLSQKQDKYLEWAAFEFGKSKTEIIHEAIDQKIKSDNNYTRSSKSQD